jgi:ferritin-like metal-binding protein YciE
MQAMNSMQDLMTTSLQDLYTTERRQLQALPMVMNAVQTDELRQALQQHQQETQQHVQRLEQIFGRLGQQPQETPNPVLDAMVQHAQQILSTPGDPQVKEAALICEAQKFEHMEIAGYGTAAALSKQMGDEETASILAQTLSEEKQSDERLTRIAESRSNPQAAQRQ